MWKLNLFYDSVTEAALDHLVHSELRGCNIDAIVQGEDNQHASREVMEGGQVEVSLEYRKLSKYNLEHISLNNSLVLMDT